MSKIALNMIVGPFIEPFLSESIQSVLPLVEEIVLVDTAPGSNVNRPVMESFPQAKILDFENGGTKRFNYGKARELARVNTESEWFLRFDADEIFREEDVDEFLGFATLKYPVVVQTMFWHHFLHPDYYIDTVNDPKNMLFRTAQCSWVNAVHETCSYGSSSIIAAHHIKFDHYGYVRGQAEVYKRMNLYEILSGRPDIDVDPETCIAGSACHLIKYPLEHPKVVVPKLLSMYPDLGTFPDVG
jgi:hypothetical protein